MKRLISIALILIACMLTGCAFARPYMEFKDSTPIDWGLKGSFEKAIAIVPFDSHSYDKKWGIYAAQRMKEYLLEEGAFQRVIFSEEEKSFMPLLLKGEITYMWYGGSYTPSKVNVIVRIIDTSDGQTRFLKKSSISYERKGYSISWLNRMYLSSPAPEELLNGVLKHIAEDIAARTRLPVKQHP